MIWGDTDLLRRITVAVGADPAIDQLLVLYDHPQGLAPEAAASWAAVRAGIVAGADEAEAATLVASTLPDLIDDEASGELADRGVPAIAGLRTALACAQALRLPDADPGRLREIASAASQAARRRRPGAVPDADGWLDEIEAKELLRAAGIAVPEGRVVASEDECGGRGGRAGRAGGAEAGDARLRHKSEAGALRLDLRTTDEARAAYRGLSALPAAAGGAGAGGANGAAGRRAPGRGPRRRGRPGAGRSASAGSGPRRSTTSRSSRCPPTPSGSSEAIRSLRGAAALAGGRGREAVDLAAAAALAAAIGSLLLESGLDLLELNPVVVHPEGCVALDALGRRPAPSTSDASLTL